MGLYNTELEKHLFEWERKLKTVKPGYVIAAAVAIGAGLATLIRLLKRKSKQPVDKEEFI